MCTAVNVFLTIAAIGALITTVALLVAMYKDGDVGAALLIVGGGVFLLLFVLTGAYIDNLCTPTPPPATIECPCGQESTR